MSNPSKLLTTREAAEHARVPLRTIQDAVKGGRLLATRFGKLWQIRERDLKNFKPRPRGWQKGRSRKEKGK